MIIVRKRGIQVELENKATIKIIKFLSVIILFTVSNSFSQPKIANYLFNNELIPQLQRDEKSINFSQFELEISKILLRKTYFSNMNEMLGDLDSVVVTMANGNQKIYNYYSESNAKITTEVFKKLNGNIFANFSRSTFKIYFNGDIISELDEIWVEEKWVNADKRTYTFDSNGNQTLFFNEQWDGSKWNNDVRLTHVYDAKGNCTSILAEKWDGTNLVPITRVTYNFDFDENCMSKLGEKWDGTDWMISSRLTYKYDSNGKEILFIYEIWNGATWVNFHRRTIIYNNNSNESLYLYEE
jgi:hypothetical protein